MKRVGAHVSVQGGVENAPINAHEIGAKAFALFTKNQRQWHAKPFTAKNIDAFCRNMERCGYSSAHVLPHDSYLVNLGNPDADKRKKSLGAFIDELRRCRQLGLHMLNTHPGNHMNLASEEQCLELIADSINRALDQTEGVTVVLENTAGQGSSLGYRFEHLATLISKVEDKQRIGVCFDTCHAFAAGYDIRNTQSYRATMNEFERTVGFRWLKGMHLNDAKAGLGSRIDRHRSIGQGTIGNGAFKSIMRDRRLDELPLILETEDESLWPEEIELLYRFEGSRRSRSI
ncbi:MAG: deoxyribonuclease IV [Deltaproteobacteria bacterium]|nr:deoxyribonuclease IV [Deltaproteobacteria bacterium]